MHLKRTIHRLFPVAIAILCVSALVILLPAVHRDLNRPATRLIRSALAQGSTHFAIADFDGDLRPDLAMIRVTRNGAPTTEYSLELKFSSGKRAPIGLIGPAGGLEVSPEDVNGDQFADLVITSVVDREFVAILLNDGKGNFRQVDRAEYPHVGKRAESGLCAPAELNTYQLALRPGRNFYGDEVVSQNWQRARQDSFALLPVSDRVVPRWVVSLNPGRAPPLA